MGSAWYKDRTRYWKLVYRPIYKVKIFASHPALIAHLFTCLGPATYLFPQRWEGGFDSLFRRCQSVSEWATVHHSAEWGLSDALSNFDFPPLMAKKIGLSPNFESNQLKKEISDSKSDPQYLIRIPSSTIYNNGGSETRIRSNCWRWLIF